MVRAEKRDRDQCQPRRHPAEEAARPIRQLGQKEQAASGGASNSLEAPLNRIWGQSIYGISTARVYCQVDQVRLRRTPATPTSCCSAWSFSFSCLTATLSVVFALTGWVPPRVRRMPCHRCSLQRRDSHIPRFADDPRAARAGVVHSSWSVSGASAGGRSGRRLLLNAE